MRLFAKDLLATKGTKMIVSDWSEPYKVTYTTTNGTEKTLNFFDLILTYKNVDTYINLFNSKDEFISSNNGLQYFFSGSIDGDNYPRRLAVGTYASFAILSTTHWATKTSNSWNNPVAFSTKGNWANCNWLDVINDNNNTNFLVVGKKIVSGKEVGVYVTYNQSNFGTSWSFNTPTTLATAALKRAQRYGNKVIVVGNEGYIALATGVYIDTSTVWDIHKIGDGSIDWEYVAYGNGLFVVASQDGYITISSDDGATWSEPVKNTELDVIGGITFAVNKFFLCGYSKIVTTTNGKKFKTNKVINTSAQNPYEPYWDYIGYNGTSVIVASTDRGYIAQKTWKLGG